MKTLLLALLLTQVPATPVVFTLEGNKLVLPAPVVFDAGSAVLKVEATKAALDHVAAYLAEKRYITQMRVEGHTADASKAGQILSEQRAGAVVAALVARGVDCKRLLAVGFGGTKPIVDPATPAGRTANNRIELVNAALAGRLIGGAPADGGGVVAGDACAKP